VHSGGRIRTMRRGIALAAAFAAGAQAFAPAPPGVPLRNTAVAASPRAGLAPAAAARAPFLRSQSLVTVPRRRAVGARPLSALAATATGEPVANVAVVLLAGGVGSRMKAGKPKQFLELEGKTILRTSLDIFLGLEGVTSISVVLAEEYRDQLADLAAADSRESA